MKNPSIDAGNATPILVVVIAIIALAILWFIFSRPPEDTIDIRTAPNESMSEAENELRTTLETTATEAELATARAEARTRLLALEAELEAEQNYAAALAAAAEIETDLAAAYRNTSANFQQEWIRLRSGFDQLETQLRAETADALSVIAALSAELEANVRTDDDSSTTSSPD